MSHTRFKLGFPRHRKIAGLSDAAFRLWASAMDRAREELTDGALTLTDLELIPRCPAAGAGRTKLVKELVDAELWEVVKPEAEWLIHDFLDWQDSAAQVKKKQSEARDRMRRARDGKGSGSGGSSDGGSPARSRERSSEQHENFAQHNLTLTPISSSSDPDQPDRSPKPERPEKPFDLASALLFPLLERAAFCVQDPHGIGQFCKPGAWPEMVAVGRAVEKHLGWRFALGSYPKDGGVSAGVELFAAGYTQADLELAAELAAKSPWFSEDKSRRVLSSFTPKVVARLLAAGKPEEAVSGVHRTAIDIEKLGIGVGSEGI